MAKQGMYVKINFNHPKSPYKKEGRVTSLKRACLIVSATMTIAIFYAFLQQLFLQPFSQPF
jgi:hypothetical protein